MNSKEQANRNAEGFGTPAAERTPRPSNGAGRFLPFLLTFIIMLVVWILLSGKFDSFHFSLGVIASAMVAFFSGDLLFDRPEIKGFPAACLRFGRYIPWLIYQIFLANLHLLYLSFHPRMMDLIDPQIFKFKSKLRQELSLVTFANSITLTPGTITVYVSMNGDFSVHAIDRQSMEGLPGDMEKRVARAFGEE